ncbi:MAG: phytanoyl-CoA dioxygenase family protein [Planctomycetes bacterium]|nr:phytanoyl-CoA dioxygenase family protein [Planctomycetota bacterium]
MPSVKQESYFTGAEHREMKESFTQLGYIQVPILTEGELAHLREVYAEVLDAHAGDEKGEVSDSSLQHLGDRLQDFAQENKNYYFHILTTSGTQSLHHAYYHEKIIEVVENLLGPELIINNASMLAANVGTLYNLGWHRDVIQIPEEEIRDDLFSSQRFHNSCQINLPLFDEDCLQVVPASHNRANSNDENEAFAGTKHYAPLDACMPGGQKVAIPAGSALFYNNNIIHRGYSDGLKDIRRTLHMGFHSAQRKPTWHFYLLNPQDITQEYLQTLDPKMCGMMEDYLACYEMYPDMAETWQAGWDGNP